MSSTQSLMQGISAQAMTQAKFGTGGQGIGVQRVPGSIPMGSTILVVSI